MTSMHLSLRSQVEAPDLKLEGARRGFEGPQDKEDHMAIVKFGAKRLLGEASRRRRSRDCVMRPYAPIAVLRRIVMLPFFSFVQGCF
jgi:hypothetical protein